VLGWLTLLCVSAAGCARGPQVTTDELPLRRVVVYRNGVAYFERAGSVQGEEVKFRLRQENVGDFLATLAIMERGGSTVRAASFPVEIETEEPPSPEVEAALRAWERHERGGDGRKLRRVTLELDGGEHELAVGYLAETPLWRPSYRLVVQENGKADLQAWGIVQNQSGEDWKNVSIALVAGAPIAFESTLGNPVTPPRPVVSDTGEVISSVPGAVTSYGPDEEMAEEAAREEELRYEGKPKSARRSSADADDAMDQGYGGLGRGAPAGAPAPPPAPMDKSMAPAPRAMGPSAPRDARRLAQVQVQTGSTRYEVPHTVTIPDRSATMILLVNQPVPGEAVFLYAPDGGVPDSHAHPFRVARFTNASGGLLERGPIAVFEKGAFLGQGMLESLPAKAHATVPFALVRALGVEQERNYDQRGARLYSVDSGTLQVERDQATITTYRVKNGSEEAAKLLVRHPRSPGARLHNPPKGTEDNVGQGHALVPVQVAAGRKAELVVEERRAVQQVMDWMSPVAEEAVAAYVREAGPKGPGVEQLQQAFVVRRQLELAQDQERKLQREQAELEKSSRETRLSLQAIEKNTQAADLRAKLTRRLADATGRLDQITKELIELRMRIDEQQVRFRDAVLAIRVPPRK
jgi:hypothetical protein